MFGFAKSFLSFIALVLIVAAITASCDTGKPAYYIDYPDEDACGAGPRSFGC